MRSPGMLAIRRVGMMAVALLAASRAQAQQSPSAMLGLDSLLNTPVSTASKYDQTVRQVAGSVTIVTDEDIRRFGYRTLSDVLQTMPGIYTSYDRNYSSVGVRGFGRPTDFNNRILLLINGHTTNESMWGSAMLGDDLVLNLHGVSRIEVIRGPASALYGTGAMFAVINVITRQDEGVTAGRVDLEAGGYGKRAGSATLDLPMGANRGVAMSAIVETADGRDLFFPEFNAPATNSGIAHDLDWQRRGAVMLSARRGEFDLTTRFSTRRKGTPTASYGTIFNDPASRVRDDAFYAELKFEKPLSDVRNLMIRSYYDDYAYHGVYPYPGDRNTDRATNRVLGVEAAYRWDPVPSDRLTVGAEYRRNLTTEYESKTGPSTYSLSRAFSVTSLYLQNDLQLLHNLSLLAGIRRDGNSISGNAVTPRLALVFDPRAGTTIKAMYGTAFRAPSIYETGQVAAGSAGTLKPERLKMSELILIQRLSDGILFTGSLYHYAVRDLIDAVSADPNTPVVYRNLSRATANGLEASLDARFAGGIRGYLNYGYQRAVTSDSANSSVRLTNSPAHLAKLGIAAALLPQASVALELRYESGRKTVVGTETGQFLLVNLNLLSHPFGAGPGSRAGLGNVELGVSVINLLNTRYSYPGGVEHLQDSIPQDGRTFIARLTSRF